MPTVQKEVYIYNENICIILKKSRPHIDASTFTRSLETKKTTKQAVKRGPAVLTILVASLANQSASNISKTYISISLQNKKEERRNTQNYFAK